MRKLEGDLIGGVSIFLGIISLLTSFIGLVLLAVPLVGLVLGFIHYFMNRKYGDGSLGKAGMILNGLGLLIYIGWIVYTIYFK